MLRSIGIGGIALAVLVVGAMLAPSAMAQQGVLTSDGPVKLDATEIAGEENSFSAFGAVMACPGSVGTGFKYNVTPHELIPSGATAITGVPDFNQLTCKLVEGANTHKVTITTNGCDGVTYIGETVGGEGKYSGTAETVCPEGKAIEFEIYPFANSELGGVICTLRSGPQTVSGPTVRTNAEADDLVISGSIPGTEVSKSGAGCTSETTHNASITVSATVKGTNEEGGNTGITITDS